MTVDVEVFAKELIEKYKIWSVGIVGTDIEITSAKQCAIQDCQSTIEELKKVYIELSPLKYINQRIHFYKLITVPTFEFKQGSHIDNKFEENPIHVDFYMNAICLRQDGEYMPTQEQVLISYKYLEKLFKEIKKHQANAKAMLDK